MLAQNRLFPYYWGGGRRSPPHEDYVKLYSVIFVIP